MVKSILDSSIIKKSTEIIFIFTILVFLIGHLSAFFYFSSWNLPYLKLTDTATAFAFALESTGVFLLMALILILMVIFLNTNRTDRDDLSENETELASMKLMERIFYKLKVNIIKLFFLIVITLFFFYSIYIITSGDIRQDIKDKNYIPFEVAFSKGSIVHSCVTSLGTLGNYSVFVNELEQIILVRKDEITYIKQMLLSPPLERLPAGRVSVSNPNYKIEREQWLTAWDAVCGSYTKSLNFMNFDFKTDGKPPRTKTLER